MFKDYARLPTRYNLIWCLPLACRCYILLILIALIKLINQSNGMSELLEKSYFKNVIKNKYSFGKSQRFPSIKASSRVDYYQLPLQGSKRSCSFGYGSKFDFFKVPNNPAASQYFQAHNQKVSGSSFGMGREVSQALLIIESEGQQLLVFTDGKSSAYFINRILHAPMYRIKQYKYNPKIDCLANFKSSPKITMVQKHWNDSFIIKNDNPQPSKYHPDMEIEGKLKLSNFSTPKKTVFAKKQRFQGLKRNCWLINADMKSTLGPGAYHIRDQISSKRKNSSTIQFSSAVRNTYVVDSIKKSISPGPKYLLP